MTNSTLFNLTFEWDPNKAKLNFRGETSKNL